MAGANRCDESPRAEPWGLPQRDWAAAAAARHDRLFGRHDNGLLTEAEPLNYPGTPATAHRLKSRKGKAAFTKKPSGAAYRNADQFIAAPPRHQLNALVTAPMFRWELRPGFCS